MLSRWFRRSTPEVLDVALSSASTYVVRQSEEGYRELVEVGSREMVHTRVSLDAPLRSGFSYIDAMHVAIALNQERIAPKALCLGGGGGVIARQQVECGAEVDVVERSGLVIDLAEKHFGLTSGPSLTIHRGDAATFVEQSNAARYDVVLVDLFGPFEASPLLASERFFANIRRIVREGGAIAVNTVGAFGGDAGAMFATERALAKVFGDAVSLPMLSADERAADTLTLSAPRNVVLFASKRPLPPEVIAPYAHDDLPALPTAIDDINRRLAALAVARAQAARSEPMQLGNEGSRSQPLA